MYRKILVVHDGSEVAQPLPRTSNSLKFPHMKSLKAILKRRITEIRNFSASC